MPRIWKASCTGRTSVKAVTGASRGLRSVTCSEGNGCYDAAARRDLKTEAVKGLKTERNIQEKGAVALADSALICSLPNTCEGRKRKNVLHTDKAL